MPIENLGAVIVVAFCASILGFVASVFMERPFSRWFAYGLALLPMALVHLIVIGANDKTDKRAPKIGAFILFLLVCSAIYGLYRQAPGAFPFSLVG